MEWRQDNTDRGASHEGVTVPRTETAVDVDLLASAAKQMSAGDEVEIRGGKYTSNEHRPTNAGASHGAARGSSAELRSVGRR